MIGFVLPEIRLALTLIWLIGGLSACISEAEKKIQPSGSNTAKERVMSQTSSASSDQGVSGLPHARGRTFYSLDEYLAYLEETQGPIDKPWWREIKPGLYEHMIRMPGAERETATREELMKRYGFER